MTTTAPAPPATPDAGRERELEDLEIVDPTVVWLPADRVQVTMSRHDLDFLIGQMKDRPRWPAICDCSAASDTSFQEGKDEGYDDALADIKRLAEQAS